MVSPNSDDARTTQQQGRVGAGECGKSGHSGGVRLIHLDSAAVSSQACTSRAGAIFNPPESPDR